MSGEIMNTKEVAQYLDIHEKQVYALIKAKRIPATRVTGKWIFPKKLIDDWIESNAKGGMAEARRKGKKIEGALLAAGSNDPILDILNTFIKQSHPDLFIFSANVGSTDGLKALNQGYTDLAWSHLLDPKSGEYNTPFLSAYLPNLKPVVINLFYRELGFLTAPGNPLHFRGFADLAKKKIRFINRQKGSGTRVLLDHHLKNLDILSSNIQGYENEVYTHFEVGMAINAKEADVGIATVAAAKLLGLSFIPITQESFDMLMDQTTFFDKNVQAFIEILNSHEFRSRVDRLGSYDFKNSGKILYAQKS
ncbi:MAG: molybdate-binding protein domain [Deltaproteobacteria bacterium]|jgi:excisionase family DNA binding protein|nr:molybdate-binding protein domain [Deltaproteobacteria bacterium]